MWVAYIEWRKGEVCLRTGRLVLYVVPPHHGVSRILYLAFSEAILFVLVECLTDK